MCFKRPSSLAAKAGEAYRVKISRASKWHFKKCGDPNVGDSQHQGLRVNAEQMAKPRAWWPELSQGLQEAGDTWKAALVSADSAPEFAVLRTGAWEASTLHPLA